MTPKQAGALMRYADELADIRVIPFAALAVLQRLVWKYRPKTGRTACVGLDEIAGDGAARGTVIKLLRALERARLIVKEGWGVVTGGRWRQMPNKYHLRTVDEAKAAAIAAAEEDGEPEYVLGTVSLPVSESKSCAVFGVIESDSSIPKEEEEAQQGRVGEGSERNNLAPSMIPNRPPDPHARLATILAVLAPPEFPEGDLSPERASQPPSSEPLNPPLTEHLAAIARAASLAAVVPAFALAASAIVVVAVAVEFAAMAEPFADQVGWDQMLDHCVTAFPSPTGATRAWSASAAPVAGPAHTRPNPTTYPR